MASSSSSRPAAAAYQQVVAGGMPIAPSGAQAAADGDAAILARDIPWET